MTLDLGKIREATKQTVLEFPGIGELQFEYRPAALTKFAGMQDAMQSANQLEQIHMLAEVLAATIAWWDLYDNDAPVPISVETIEALPISFLCDIMNHIGKCQNPQ